MKIQQLMTREVAACHPGTSLNDAAHEMWVHDCGSLPVVSDDEERRVVGMITDRDICMAAYHRGASLKELRVEEAMSKQVWGVGPDDDVERACEIMEEGKVRRVPVIDRDGHLEGLLSLAQLARAATGGDGRRGSLHEETVARVLGSIVEPTPGPKAEAPKF